MRLCVLTVVGMCGGVVSLVRGVEWVTLNRVDGGNQRGRVVYWHGL